MKITSIRHDKDAGREMMTVYDADVLMEKMKTETRDGYVTGLRTVMPQLEGTGSTFAYIILTNFHVSILPWSAPGLKTEGEG